MSCASVLFALCFPPILLATIPAGLIAMSNGRRALKNGTTLTSKAKTGKTLGLLGFILGGVMLVAFIAVIISFAGYGG